MNIRCPNCGAVFPGPAAGQQAECPLCLHGFAPDGNLTVSVSGAPAPAPSARDEDEFESFGAGGQNTTALGGGGSAFGGGGSAFGGGGGFGGTTGSGGGFGGTTGSAGGLGSDPFAAPADDPFASPGGGGGDVDFGALLGDVGSGGDADPFGLDAGSGADSGLFADDEPFGAAGASDDDALFGEEDEDSLFLATANTSGAIFDEEDEPRQSTMDRAVAEAAEAVERRREPSGDDEARSRDLGPLIDRVLGGLLVILLVGIGLDYAGMPAFGLGDFLPSLGGAAEAEAEAERQRKRRMRPIPRNLADPTDIKDTAASYQLEVERLKKVSAVRPDDVALQGQLLTAYLDLLERYPVIFLADAGYPKETTALAKKLKSARHGVVDLLVRQELLEIGPKLEALAKSSDANDLGSAAWGYWVLHQAKTRQESFDNPGRFSDPAVDPLLEAHPEDPQLGKARALADRALELAAKATNRIKFVMIQARLNDATGQHDKHMEALKSFVPTAKEALEPRLLLISGLIRSNHLGKAATEIKRLVTDATDADDQPSLTAAFRHEAWLAHKRGRVDDQITAMEAVLKLAPEDELTTVRLGRLLLREKRAQECQKLLTTAKKAGMKSIAFEVAFVEYWLWANRNDDALAEITEATKRYPDSVDLLFLRGQVEEQQQHTATARDFYAKVIRREPKHLRAALRLATLQSKAGRHDDALATLSATRKRLGDKASILEPMAEELKLLGRVAESRTIFGLLLKQRPSHKGYLLNAARMDLKAGRVDSALKFLRVLRDEGALDKEGAKQMAIALASKGKPAEAAKTLVDFADRNPNDIRLNALSGQYMLDSGDLERAETLLKRAFRVAHRQGGDAETLFQYGRLAFRKGDTVNGITRMQQAIKAEPTRHTYRYALASSLLSKRHRGWPSAGRIAVGNLKHIIAYATRFEEQGNKVEYLADVYRKLARYYFDTQRAALAIPLLRQSLARDPNNVPTRVMLGNALYQVNDPGAEKVLREVLKLQKNNHRAALYLGLTLQNSGKVVQAIPWLKKATRGKDPGLAEAWYQLGLIQRDRGQKGASAASMRAFLKKAPKDHPYREDARTQLKALGG